MSTASNEQQYEQTFTTGSRCELSLTNVRGSIKVTGWDKPAVQVTAVKRLGNYMGAQQAYDETNVVLDHDGEAVSARTRMDRGFNPFAWIGLGTTPPEVQYTVFVPRRSGVAIRAVSGPIEVNGIDGSVYVRSVNGDIFLSQVSGNIMVHGVNGRIAGKELRGQLAARTVDSSVAIHQSTLASVSARTVSGDVMLETVLQPSGEYAVRTVSGGLHLLVPADSAASLDLQSASGRARCDLPCQVTDSHRGVWRAILGGGGAIVSLRSVSGGLTVSLAGVDEPPATPSPGAAPSQEPAAQPQSKEAPELAVLRAVERGEVSVDEALKQLEGLMGQ